MKKIKFEIMDYLETVPYMDKEQMLAIINPLQTTKKAQKMLDYLKENQDNPKIMRIDILLEKSLQIMKEKN